MKQAKKQEPKRWHGQQEKILKTWGENSSSYRYLHFKSYLKFKTQSTKFTLPIIIISTITGTANFAQETFPDSIREYVPIGIGGFNLFAAILTTVLQFLKVNELMEAHRVAAISFGKLARDIKLELSLPRSERQHHGKDMISRCSAEYDRLLEQSPPVPKDILAIFERIFKDTEDFEKPEITTIIPISIFDAVKEAAMTNGVVNMFRNVFSKSPPVPPSNTKSVNVPEHSINIDESVTKAKMDVMRELKNLGNKNLVSNRREGEIFEDVASDFEEKNVEDEQDGTSSELSEDEIE